MEDSLVESIFDGSSDNFSPAPIVKAKAKAKAAPKAVAKKAAVPAKPAKPRAPKNITDATTKPKPKPKTAVSKKRPKPDSEDEDSTSKHQAAHDDSLLSNTPPSAKKQKKIPVARKRAAGSEPLQDLINEAATFDGSSDPKSKKSQSATEQYQKLTQLEHIIKRPDTYIGSVERNEKQMWVYSTELEAMEWREVSYVPGLYKIFDEIIVNAADNKQRDKTMDTIKVAVDREKGMISVWNNGRGIPIEVHEKEGIYIPEMIFGHLLTGSNYDDDEAKVTGGRNGYGAKLCNIFSTKFVLETADSKSKKKYSQTWTANMSKMGTATITANKSDDYTKITFWPDFPKFKMSGMDDDFEALVKRRVYDMAGTCNGVKVHLNGDRIKISDFKKYLEMHTSAIKRERGEEAISDASQIITCKEGRWEIGFAVSDGAFQQVSFVNSIATTSGGTHVNYIADQVCSKLAEIVKKRNKGGFQPKSAQIRNHIFLFVNCLIVNPAFTSQTKEQLTTKATQFGSKCMLSDAFLAKIAKTEVIDNILAFADKKADQILKKSDGGKRSRMDNPKLTDANRAGTKDGYQCTLILTEGDSAKGMAMAGRAVVGPDFFGVFPLRGKLLNVRDASVDQVSKNAEIQNIKNILGLKHKTTYTDCKSLRYGHIMIMTDQDHDGSHIKGLLINFLQVTYPSLLKIPHFLIEFITPIVKIFKGNPKNPKQLTSFFTMPEYEAWKEAHKGERGWENKYFKGLGTSTTEEAQTYFRDLDRHLKEFHTMKDNEIELIELAFSKKKADERKEWLRQFRPGTYRDISLKEITYTDFVNKELILFSMADNLRSIPSVIDGFKPGQRKVLFACFKKNLVKDMKVGELGGYVGENTAYHHGDASLQQTIVGLAQTFVGSNNVNCLEPSGNFGSRLQGGSDSASARYIFTRLSPFARCVFKKVDEPLLTYNTDDERKIEPEHYVPIVPMILINGADGIGTGWSSSIPNYSPEDIVANLKLMMEGKPPVPMIPWFRDFKGTVAPMGPDRYKFSGIARQTGETEIEITELPIRLWTQDFKDRLVEIIKAEKTPSWIKDYDDYNTHKQVHFVIRMEEKFMALALKEGLEEKFKLTKSIATSNMVAFDPEGRITKYASVEDILKEFYAVRIKFYEKRKAWQLADLHKNLEKLSNQARFVQMIIDRQLVVSKKKKSVLVEELVSLNFTPFPKGAKKKKEDDESESDSEGEEEEDDQTVETAANSYDYLLGMPIWSLTQQRVNKLLKKIGVHEIEIDELIKLSKEDLWNRDLDEFIAEWRNQLEDEDKREKKSRNAQRRVSSKVKTQIKPGAKKRKLLDGAASDSEFETSKAKKKPVSPKITTGLPTLLSHPAKPKPAPKKQTNLDAFTAGDKPQLQLSDKDPKLGTDKGMKDENDIDDEDVYMAMDGAVEVEAVAPKPATKAKGRPRAASKEPTAKKSSQTSKPSKPPKTSKPAISLDSDEDIEEVVREAPVAVASRAPRAAARKPVKYAIGSSEESDDNGDDLLLDVGQMVKGIGSSGITNGESSRPLFSATATTSVSRPASSGGLGRKPGAAKGDDFDDLYDETDYALLAPQSGTGRGKTAKSTILSDEEQDSFEMGLAVKETALPKVAAPAKSKPSKVSAPKPAADKKPKEKAAVAIKEKKAPSKTQSPAAKAYAKKLETAKPATKKASKLIDLDSDDEIANELLSDDNVDDDGDESPVVTKRPARRAATTSQAKAKYIFGSDDDDEEDEDVMEVDNEEEDSFQSIGSD